MSLKSREVACVLLGCSVVFLPGSARAQSETAGSIAGLTRDTTGAALPGVTVEAVSHALIEKVRTVVTDDQGQSDVLPPASPLGAPAAWLGNRSYCAQTLPWAAQTQVK